MPRKYAILNSSEADSVNAKATQTGTDALLLAWSDYTTVEQRTVSTSAGSSLKALTVSEAFAGAVTKSHIWVLEETDNSGATVASSAQPYKILAVTESEKNTYEIIAVAHYDEKFPTFIVLYPLPVNRQDKQYNSSGLLPLH